MSGWRKCDTCRKVLPAAEFDGDSPTCRACLHPAPKARRTAAPVSSRPGPRLPAARGPEPPPAPRRPLLGAVGSGDLEVRERRARRASAAALEAAHPDEFAALLRQARAAEGLRPLAEPAASPAAGPTTEALPEPASGSGD